MLKQGFGLYKVQNTTYHKPVAFFQTDFANSTITTKKLLQISFSRIKSESTNKYAGHFTEHSQLSDLLLQNRVDFLDEGDTNERL